MFGFKASFYGSEVYVNGRYAYRNNEILAALLNAPEAPWKQWLAELHNYKKNLLLQDEYDDEGCFAYDENIQAAQI